MFENSVSLDTKLEGVEDLDWGFLDTLDEGAFSRESMEGAVGFGVDGAVSAQTSPFYLTEFSKSDFFEASVAALSGSLCLDVDNG